MTVRGRLEFFAETGTEGGYWALHDQEDTKLQRPECGVWAGHVWDAANSGRHGTVLADCPVQVLKGDEWLPLPDPVQADEDYAISSLFRGEFEGDHAADERLMDRYGFRMIYAEEAANATLGEGNWHHEEGETDMFVENSTGERWCFGATPGTEPSRPYGVSQGELTRVMVEWDDGLIEQRLADSLLIKSWSYTGLNILKDGDHLTIYAKDGSEVVWEGEIKLKEHDLFTEDAFGLWIHADQEGVDRDVWARWFFDHLPAELRRD